MGLGQQGVEVLERAEDGVDVAVVGDVVAEVRHGRAEEGRDPDGIDAEPGQIRKVRPDAVEVTDAVAVGVGEGPRVDLVEDGVLPPWATRRLLDLCVHRL